MLRIRLRRTGKKHQPHYRLVVAEHTAPITGKYVAILGHYNPRTKELVTKDKEILNWIDKGAKPSNTVAKLLTKQGLKHKQIVIHKYPERPGKKEAQEAKEAAESSSAETPAATTSEEKSEEVTPENEAEEKTAEPKTEEVAEDSKDDSEPAEQPKEEPVETQDNEPQKGSEESK
ncbi:30S ribosomal protein S16 [Candidatus Berkelbacteria bacterium]|nr:30S ribosomal protein S16 [Candidatus Berkelbacteria bacterium]